MRVALGILNKEIERLQVEIDFLESGESNPPKLLRLKADIEELLLAWQVLKDWKEPKEMDFSKFFKSSEYVFGQELISKDSNGKYDHCRCVSTDPTDVTLCDRCPDNVMGNPYRNDADKGKVFSVSHEGDRFDPDQKEIPLVNISSSIEP